MQNNYNNNWFVSLDETMLKEFLNEEQLHEEKIDLDFFSLQVEEM